ncbi:MAG TPA: hypothetical protein VGL22_05425 [Terracidiphilus sp.]|jgi:hypothetical protein
MPRCILCDEWAGPDSDLHDHCAIEFKRQMQQLGPFARLLRRTRRAARFLYAMISGSTAGTQ